MNILIARLIAISAILTVSACGGGNSASVAYVGNTLFIDGTPYSQEETPKHIVPGEIIVLPKEGMREEVRRLVAGYQLRILRDDSRLLLVSVAPGYEQQWVTVFRQQAAVADASTSPAVATRQGQHLKAARRS